MIKCCRHIRQPKKSYLDYFDPSTKLRATQLSTLPKGRTYTAFEPSTNLCEGSPFRAGERAGRINDKQ